MNIYVGNLANDTLEEDLQELFQKFGQVTSVKVIKDKYSNLSRGFGFIEMPDNSEADSAIKALNGQDLKGKLLKISQARPKSPKKSRRGGRERFW